MNDSHESVQMPSNDRKSVSVSSQKYPMSVSKASHSPQERNEVDDGRARRKKLSKFTPADKELARSLLNQYDTERTFGSGKWAFGVRDNREKVLEAIYGPFRLQCSKNRQGSVTKEQLKKLLYVIRRQEAACSGLKSTIKEELVNYDVSIKKPQQSTTKGADVEMGENFENKTDLSQFMSDSHEIVEMPTNFCKSPSVPGQQSLISVSGAPHSPQGGNEGDNGRAGRSKSSKFSPADRELARSLLNQYDTEGTFGSGRWAGDAREEREKVLEAIYGPFCLQCSEERQGRVTKEQLKKLLYAIRRQDAAKNTTETDYEGFCDICGKKSSSLSKMEEHKKAVHGAYSERKHKCDQLGCSKAYLHLYQLKIHQRAAHGGGYMCDLCGKSVRTKTMLSYHIKLVHKKESLKTKCPHCGEVFKHHNARRKHMLNLHNIGKHLKCELCERKFMSKFCLTKHMSMHGQPAFECSQCGKKVGSQYSLKAHMGLHTGELFECPFCLWEGNRKNKLKEHKERKHKQELEDELAQEFLKT